MENQKVGQHVRKHFVNVPGSDVAKENAFIAKLSQGVRRGSIVEKDMQFDQLLLIKAAQKAKIVPLGVKGNKSNIDFTNREPAMAPNTPSKRVYAEKYISCIASMSGADQSKNVSMTPTRRHFPQQDNRETTPEMY